MFLKKLCLDLNEIYCEADDTLFGNIDNADDLYGDAKKNIEKVPSSTVTKIANKKHNFESAIAELESITKKLDSGDMALDDALDLYKQGVELKKICEKELKKAKELMEKIYEESLKS